MMLRSGVALFCAAAFFFSGGQVYAQNASDRPIQLVPAFPTGETTGENSETSPQEAPEQEGSQTAPEGLLTEDGLLIEEGATGPERVSQEVLDNNTENSGDEAAVSTQNSDLRLEAETLVPLDPAGTGPLSQENGGLPVDMWRGASLDRIQSLLSYLPDRQDSRVLEELTRRFLLSQARLPTPVAPNSENTPDQNTEAQNTDSQDISSENRGDAPQRQAIVSLRLDRLAALGYVDAAVNFWRSLSRKIPVPVIPLIERLFEAGAFAQACMLISETQSQPIDVFDPQAIIFDTACKIESGRLAEAALNIELIREFPDSDPVFLDLAWRAAHPDFTLDTPPPSPIAPVHYALLAHLEATDLEEAYTKPSPLDPQAVQRAMRSFVASLGAASLGEGDMPDQEETWPFRILLDSPENTSSENIFIVQEPPVIQPPARVYDILYQLPQELYPGEFPVDWGWESLPNGAHHQRSGLESSATLRGLIERARTNERWGEAVAGYLIGARGRDVADLSAEEIGLGARLLVDIGLSDLARLFALDALEVALYPPAVTVEPDSPDPELAKPDLADPFADVSSLLISDSPPIEEDQLE